LQQFVNAYYATVPQSVQVQPKARKRLTVQMDELWSFVDDKGNEQWVWLALDAETREIVGCHVGNRSGESAKALWQSLPPIVNVQFAIQISGCRTQLLFPVRGIDL
jgi:insertion element IS1 protein InsB